MLLSVVFILLFFFVLYILFVPIELFIDTRGNNYYLQLKGLAKVQIEGHQDEVLRIKLMAFFMRFYFYPLRKWNTTKKKGQKKEIAKKKRKYLDLKKGLRLLRSFKVKRLLIEMDTGDCISNAKLYPVFAFLDYHVGEFYINFEGRNRLAIHLQNRPIRIIKSFINF
ncbi:hypothetical protein [Muriicola sp. Z0-33]|uniref:hypothetical protein n=1 Tax=Muriicola sp. Z0-33 TaxID=2816957 RepID=UPI002237F78E|nr:hypothetical protein [Muriicola sp. Z0-33]MCW5517982.1 hypothetical protein [Muriicola sp. Z0-33]